jgi:hypothetical protein
MEACNRNWLGLVGVQEALLRDGRGENAPHRKHKCDLPPPTKKLLLPQDGGGVATAINPGLPMERLQGVRGRMP